MVLVFIMFIIEKELIVQYGFERVGGINIYALEVGSLTYTVLSGLFE